MDIRKYLNFIANKLFHRVSVPKICILNKTSKKIFTHPHLNDHEKLSEACLIRSVVKGYCTLITRLTGSELRGTTTPSMLRSPVGEARGKRMGRRQRQKQKDWSLKAPAERWAVTFVPTRSLHGSDQHENTHTHTQRIPRLHVWRIQMITGTAIAILPTSASFCMIFLMRLWEHKKQSCSFTGHHRYMLHSGAPPKHLFCCNSLHSELNF